MSSMPPVEAPPLVSVVMAFHNAAPFLRDAMTSVLRQSHGRLELLLCDDASTDGGPAIAADMATRDGRIRLLHGARQAGPGAARNRGLDAARGAWIAIVDADDLLHPRRIEGLLDLADRTSADVIADDLVPFGAEGGTTLLAPLRLKGPWRPDATALLDAEQGTPPVAVGYLKPMIRRSAMAALRYRTDLPIGEDLDLLLRLSLWGARLRVVARPWYLYRRHAASTSHRLSAANAAAILAGIDALAADHPDWAGTATTALQTWRNRTERTRDFSDLVDAFGQRKVARALGMLGQRPGLSLDLGRAIVQGRMRRARAGWLRRDETPLVLSAPDGGPDGGPDGAGSGARVRVPRDATGWDGAQAAALARLTGSGRRHLRAIGRPGLLALGHVPGWRLAELIAPPDGWTVSETAEIAQMPWPVLQGSDHHASGFVPHAPRQNPLASPHPDRAAY